MGSLQMANFSWLCLWPWFSHRGDLVPGEHLTMSGGVFVATSWGGVTGICAQGRPLPSSYTELPGLSSQQCQGDTLALCFLALHKHHEIFSFPSYPGIKSVHTMRISHPQMLHRGLARGSRVGIASSVRVRCSYALKETALCPEVGIQIEKAGWAQALVLETQLIFRRLRHGACLCKNQEVSWLDRNIQERADMTTCQAGKVKAT